MPVLGLALLAQSAAPPGNEQIRHSIILPQGQSTTDKQGAAGKGEHLDFESFRWGPRQPASADGSAPAQGSVIVKLEKPWTSCQVGAAFPSLVLIGGGKHHLLEEVTVSSCGGDAAKPEEGITFAYGKVTVSDWDSKKKE
jgi:hypothetical protein